MLTPVRLNPFDSPVFRRLCFNGHELHVPKYRFLSRYLDRERFAKGKRAMRRVLKQFDASPSDRLMGAKG